MQNMIQIAEYEDSGKTKFSENKDIGILYSMY